MAASATTAAFVRAARAAAASPVRRQHCRVGASRGQAVDLYHEIHGEGRHKVLFITGWAGSCDNWRFQTDFFGSHGDFEVAIYENRGSGFSSAPMSKYRMRDMAEDARDLVAHLGWDKCHVVGVSMGGMIAQELALLLPGKLASLCLASTHAGRGLPPSEHIPMIMSIFAQVSLGLAEIKHHVPKLLYSSNWLENSAPIGSGCRNNLEYMLKSFRAAMAQLWGICRHYVSPERLSELRAALAATSIPAMVIHGSEDCLIHARNAYHLAKQIGAPLVLFEGRGHAMNHEDIETFNALLLRHFYSAITDTKAQAATLSGWASLRSAVESHASRVGDSLHKIFADIAAEVPIEIVPPIAKPIRT
nr:hypothetical protein HK105_000357 [Polyrhizophydium stewartii]